MFPPNYTPTFTPNLHLELFSPLGVGWREDATAGAILDENMALIDAFAAGGGGGGSSVSINSATVASANFNGATPVAPAGKVNVTWQVSGSSVSAYAPAQVQTDWNAVAGLGVLLNKPTLAQTFVPITAPSVATEFLTGYNAATGTFSGQVIVAADLGLAAVATSGSYNDLSNKPTIPAAQVNSDWNSVAGVSQILNKPVLAQTFSPITSPSIATEFLTGYNASTGTFSGHTIDFADLTGGAPLLWLTSGAVSAPSPAVTGNLPAGLNPCVWIQKSDGNWYPTIAIDPTSPAPGGILHFVDRTWFSDSGLTAIPGQTAMHALFHRAMVDTPAGADDRTLYVANWSNSAQDGTIRGGSTYAAYMECGLYSTPQLESELNGNAFGAIRTNTFLNAPQIAITSVSVSGNVATIIAHNTLYAAANQQSVYITGLSNVANTWLNNLTWSVATASPTQFTINHTIGSYGATADTGVAWYVALGGWYGHDSTVEIQSGTVNGANPAIGAYRGQISLNDPTNLAPLPSAASFYACCVNNMGTKVLSYIGFKSDPPSTYRAAQNIGFYCSDFGTNAADYSFYAAGGQAYFGGKAAVGGNFSVTGTSSLTGALTLGIASSSAGSLILAQTTAFATTIVGAASANWTLTLPTGPGSPNYVLQTDGTGITSWVAASGGGFTSPMSANGDMIYENASLGAARIPIGTTGQVLTVVAGEPAWATASSGFANPMSVAGDIIYENASLGPARLPIGTTSQVLTVVAGEPVWATPAGGNAWSALTAAAGILTINNANYNTEFDQTSATTWTHANLTPTVTGATTTLAISTSTAPINVSGNIWRYTFAATESGAGTNAWVNAIVTISGYSGTSSGNNIASATILASTTTTFDITNTTGTALHAGTPVVISSAVVGSPILTLSGTINSGTAGTLNSIADSWTIQAVPASVAPNPVSLLTIGHSGSAGNAPAVNIAPYTAKYPALIFDGDTGAGIGSNGGVNGLVAFIGAPGANAKHSLAFSQVGGAAALMNAFIDYSASPVQVGLELNAGTNYTMRIGGNGSAFTANAAFLTFSNIGKMEGITTGTQTFITETTTFDPASGQTNIIFHNINPTVNQTGNPSLAAGSYTALKVAVIETSVLGSSNMLLDLFAGSAGTAEMFGVNSKGIISEYAGVATVSQGVPAEYATVDLTGQGAAINATTIYAVPAASGGMYRISWCASVTTADGAASVLGGTTGFQILYMDTSVVKTSPRTITSGVNTDATNTTATAISGTIVVYADASTNIQYQMGYTSTTPGQMKYDLHIKCERL